MGKKSAKYIFTLYRQKIIAASFESSFIVRKYLQPVLRATFDWFEIEIDKDGAWGKHFGKFPYFHFSTGLYP